MKHNYYATHIVTDIFLFVGTIGHEDESINDRTVVSHIRNIRKKISGVAADLELIHSVYGAGYKFEAETKP